MFFRLYIPRAPLAAFIDFLWYHEDRVPLNPKERILPTGAVDMLINLNDDPLQLFDGSSSQCFSGAFVCGPHSEFFTIDPTKPQVVLGVHFKPGCAFLFLGLPADELLNMSISLDTLWDRLADDLRDQILAARTLDHKFAILEAVLIKRLEDPCGLHPAVGFAIREFQEATRVQRITAITDQIGLSQQRFGQLFRHEVGLPPKLFYRLQRFYQVLHLVKKDQPIDWADIALTCGYFDQAHFIRDFQAFSGLNPTAYLTLRGKEAADVKQLAATSPEIMYGSL